MSGHLGMPAKIFLLTILLVIGVQTAKNASKKTTSNLLLFDFRNVTDVNDWSEESDAAKSAGKSKGSFDLYKNQVQQSAIFFSLLNPLSSTNSACFSGVRTKTRLSLDGYRFICFTCTAKGNATTYKIVLRHNSLDYPSPSFEQHFTVKTDVETPIRLPIQEFNSYFRGSKLLNGPIFNVKNITLFGIQVDGEVNESYQQSGVSAFIVDRIWAES